MSRFDLQRERARRIVGLNYVRLVKCGGLYVCVMMSRAFAHACCDCLLRKRLTDLISTCHPYDDASISSRLTALFHTVQQTRSRRTERFRCSGHQSEAVR
jgi:hypothetical protein